MSDTPETLAAILAEMRHQADNHRLDGWESVAEELEEFCDRIDAAAAREYAQWHGETNAAKEERNRIACKMRYEFAAKCRACKSAPGNAAAMRKALERIVGWCEGCHADACEKVCRPELTSESIHAALAALAAPPRNCDRPFRSVNEAIGAYVGERGDGPHLGYCDAIKWALAPTEKGGAS